MTADKLLCREIRISLSIKKYSTFEVHMILADNDFYMLVVHSGSRGFHVYGRMISAKIQSPIAIRTFSPIIDS